MFVAAVPSPTNTGRRPRKCGSARYSASVVPLSIPGLPDFENAFSLLHHETVVGFVDQPLQQGLGLGRQFWRLPVMQGQGQALVFEQQRGMSRDEWRQRLPDGLLGVVRGSVAMELSGCVAALQAVLASLDERRQTKAAFEIAQRPAADHR